MLHRKRFYSSSSWSEWRMLLRKRFHSSSSWSEWKMFLRKRFYSNSSWSEWRMLLRKRFHSSSSWSIPDCISSWKSLVVHGVNYIFSSPIIRDHEQFQG
jgi:hypothetical protein